MKNLLALLAGMYWQFRNSNFELQNFFLASTYAQDDDTIVVTLKASDGNVKKGDSAVFTCSWTLNDEYSKSFYVSLYRPYDNLYGESSGLILDRSC